MDEWDHARRLPKLIWSLAVVNALAVFALGASRMNWPSIEFWSGRAGWIISALALTAAVPLVQAIIAERGERRRRKAIEREQTVQTFLIASLIYVIRHAHADWENTGIQAFGVRGYHRWAHQVRLSKIRLGAIPSSGIRWTKGKGVIGRCWETRSPQYEDLSVHFAPYLDCAKEQWDALPAGTRFGLSFSDFQTQKGKYGIVAAVPMVDRKDKYIGCVTADMPPQVAGGKLPIREELLKSLAGTARLVAEVLSA